MRRYIARRLLLLVPVLLGVSIVVFMVLHLSPGDPAEIMLGSQATQEDLERLHPEVVLLIQHQAEGLATLDHRRRSVTTGGVFAGNQVALDENLLLHRG